ncbi:Serine aminopeptidase, S33 [Sporobacter termitidis DSM 10068]|uniref:Serine aminopeptidase, S33 n=1 Tax=Sporobacter termitidis DSM 10068 TaxID=1123282 RepID=A0A1M5YYX4_9FIRM|nr:alpha/beta hydrolase [Sporobacter termitidis]SHI16753.1 Serine aminopeptidase, S33 [Sporobacter termitidis DSM 10068]
METAHLEYHYRLKTSDTVIVFIHGIQGSPLQFDYLIKKLHGTYSIENLLLPGHGKTMKAFIKSNINQWQNYVDERINLLEKDYENIILVGHSMGCLLSVQSALSYPQKIRGLYLIAMPLNIHVTYAYIKNNILIAFSKGEKNDVITAARKGNSTSVSNPFEYLTGIPRYIELLRKCKLTRVLIKRLQLPIVIVQSETDEIVSNKSLQHVENRQNIRVITAKASGHYYYSYEAQEQISQSLEDFIVTSRQ